VTVTSARVLSLLCETQLSHQSCIPGVHEELDVRVGTRGRLLPHASPVADIHRVPYGGHAICKSSEDLC
jgi:hypothetical protein